MHRSPGLALHRRAHTYCTFCPKLCRFACPVATVEARETTTPWAKMSTLHHVAGGGLPLSDSHAASFYACSGCLRCRTFCDHENEVPAALGAGRAEAVAAGVASPAAFAVIEGYADGAAAEKRRADALWGAGVSAKIGYVAGAAALEFVPEEAKAGFEVVERLTGERPRALAPGPGFELLEAGDDAGFRAACSRFLSSLSGLSQVVFLDPDALYAARHVAPQLGLETEVPLLHLSELADQHLERFSILDGPPAEQHRYLDACKLGRGLGIYDPPRRVLARVLGGAPSEPFATRAEAECSGAGGLLPKTRPDTARAIAQERLREHARVSSGMLISACPSAQHAMSEAGEVQVRGFAGLLRAALAPRPGEPS